MSSPGPAGPEPKTESDRMHMATQHAIKRIVDVLRPLDIKTFLEKLDKADTLGMIMDPTLYREALQSGKLDLVKGLAQSLRGAQIKIEEAEARYLEGQRLSVESTPHPRPLPTWVELWTWYLTILGEAKAAEGSEDLTQELMNRLRREGSQV